MTGFLRHTLTLNDKRHTFMSFPISLLVRATITIAFYLNYLTNMATQTHAQPLTCKLNNTEINLSISSTMAGKSGVVRCFDSDGKLRREMEYRKGRPMGAETFVDFDARKTSFNTNEKGNKEGVEKTFAPAGWLEREQSYLDGRPEGLMKTYRKKDTIKGITWYANGKAVFEAGYRESGKTEELRCGERSYFRGDREICGFHGKPSTVEIYGADEKLISTQIYLNGKQQESLSFHSDGSLMKQEKHLKSSEKSLK